MSLGTNICRLRTANNLSQGELAEALGVSRQSVSKWETDASVPELDKMVKLAGLFGVTLDQLVTGEMPPAPEPSLAPPQQGMTGQRIAAVILTCMAFLVFLVLTVMGGPLEGLTLALPFGICAAVCFLAKKRAGLWCAWTVYLLAELYLRWATGITWQLTLRTFSFTPEQNYMRLAIAWVQLIAMLAMFLVTFRSFRRVRIDLRVRRNLLALGGGWVLLAVLHMLKKRLYLLLYQDPAVNFSLGVRFLLRAGDLLVLALLAVLLTVTVCALRKTKE
ncbi:MAG: helix-turn-helix domain-containing protein [Dysosmobacter sp.]